MQVLMVYNVHYIVDKIDKNLSEVMHGCVFVLHYGKFSIVHTIFIIILGEI